MAIGNCFFCENKLEGEYYTVPHSNPRVIAFCKKCLDEGRHVGNPPKEEKPKSSGPSVGDLVKRPRGRPRKDGSTGSNRPEQTVESS